MLEPNPGGGGYVHQSRIAQIRCASNSTGSCTLLRYRLLCKSKRHASYPCKRKMNGWNRNAANCEPCPIVSLHCITRTLRCLQLFLIMSLGPHFAEFAVQLFINRVAFPIYLSVLRCLQILVAVPTFQKSRWTAPASNLRKLPVGNMRRGIESTSKESSSSAVNRLNLPTAHSYSSCWRSAATAHTL